jgi:1-acyl-sn-glycerol-3-phosphate acyltransferase
VKPQVYKDPRPAEHFTRFHNRTRRRSPDPVYELVRVVLTPILVLFYRTRCIGSDKVPLEGPAIVTPNHFSFLDHFFVAVYLRRKVNFMAKSQLFKRPMQFIYTHGGVFPVLRGRRDEEAFKTAHAVLERGGLVVMYAEGGRSRTGKLGEAKPGIGRIALETGVPIVPTAISGSSEVRNWRRLRFPKVTVQYGDPIRFERVEDPTREQAQAAADLIFERIEGLYYGLQKSGRRNAIRAARRAAREAAAGAARRPAAS